MRSNRSVPHLHTEVKGEGESSSERCVEPNTAILQILLPYWYDITEIDGIDFTVHYGLLWVSLKSSENHQ